MTTEEGETIVSDNLVVIKLNANSQHFLSPRAERIGLNTHI